jgi:hypothetical protein
MMRAFPYSAVQLVEQRRVRRRGGEIGRRMMQIIIPYSMELCRPATLAASRLESAARIG